MPGALFAVIVVVFVVVGVVYVRSKQRGAIVERLPIDQDEHILLDEKGLKVFHRFRRMAVRAAFGTTLMHLSTALRSPPEIQSHCKRARQIPPHFITSM